MEILAYSCLSGMIFFAGFALMLALFKPDTRWGEIRQRLFHYILVSLFVSILGLIGFVGLSALIGTIQFGHPYASSIPQDYLARGPIGVIALAVAILAILAPLAIAVRETRKMDSSG
jgi:putative copper export protein